jgi:hypothetical protein
MPNLGPQEQDASGATVESDSGAGCSYVQYQALQAKVRCIPVDTCVVNYLITTLPCDSHEVCLWLLGGEGAEDEPADDGDAASAGMHAGCSAMCRPEEAFMHTGLALQPTDTPSGVLITS